jgi:hypothetical protein
MHLRFYRDSVQRLKTMLSEIDAEEGDALQVIDRGAVCDIAVDGSPILEVLRIGAAGAGVEQFKECRFPVGL